MDFGTVFWMLKSGGMLILSVAALFLGLLVLQQRSIIYMPVPPGTTRSPGDNPHGYSSPAEWNMPFENVTITTEDGTRINGWFVYHTKGSWVDKDPPYTVIYSHGNAGNIGHRLKNVHDMREKLKVNILIYDYRGYGDSENGTGPCQQGFLMDAMACHKWVLDRIKKVETEDGGKDSAARMSADRILLFGRSIGGSVAICLMAKLLRMHKAGGEEALPLPKGLVLENTFTSLSEIATTVFAFLKPIGFLIRSPLLLDEWRAAEELFFVAKNHARWGVCLLSGLKDQIVPPSHMKRLAEGLEEDKPDVLVFKTFPRGEHNDTAEKGGMEYWLACQDFLRKLSAV